MGEVFIKRIVLSHGDHYLHSKIQKLEGAVSSAEDAVARLNGDELVIDFTVGGTSEKRALIEKLVAAGARAIVSDTTCCNGSALAGEVPELKGAFATVFSSPKESCEYWSQKGTQGGDEIDQAICRLLEELGLTAVRVASPGIGFIYPRTVSTIVNEAYYALGDEISSPEDIDSAMKYGVGYPRGPLSWGRELGLKSVALLLEELHSHFGERYRPAPLLSEEAARENKGELR